MNTVGVADRARSRKMTTNRMSMTRLRVRANNELVLDAGMCERVERGRGSEILIRPPEVTLFRQVLAYLRSKPDPPGRLPGSAAGREGVAAAALTLRWGSYLAVLFDRDKPVWPAALSDGRSRISDEEMARINIESSAALAEWIELRRADGGGGLYGRLVDRAVGYLPMPQRTATIRVGPFAALANAELADQLVRAVNPEHLARVRADAERHSTRLFANALVNVAWRNGPAEDVHAGVGGEYPLDQRRATLAEERELMRFASAGMALGLSVCNRLEAEQPRRPWSEQVVPYGMGQGLLVTPSAWTLTEASREVHLRVGPSSELLA